MLLRFPISSHPPPIQRLALTSPLSSSHIRPHCTPRAATIRCSSSSRVSQVYSYGTVDYENKPALKWDSLYRKIATMPNPAIGPDIILGEWDREVRRLSKWDLCRVAKELRKYRRHKLALEVYIWMEEQSQRFAFKCSDVAIQLDLIAKVHGVSCAEEHFEKLSDSMKDKRVYGALLNVYGQAKMKEKAEALVDTMKMKGYAADILPFNVMMTLYMNIGEHEKVREIISELKERNVALDVFTYNIWITNAAATKDEEEMERIMGEITSDSNVNANWTTFTTFAAMYVRLGNFEKAGSCLNDAKLRMTGRDRAAFHYLIGLYGSIGKGEEVYRIWQWYKSSFPTILNLGYQSMISSLTKLGDSDGAEVIYKEWLSSTKNYDPRICNILMGSFIKDGLVDKAKDVLDDFIDKGGKPRPVTWEILVEGYTKEKKLSESLLALRAAASYEGPSKWKPRPANLSNLLNLCKEQSDKDGENMMVDLLRQRGFHELEEYKFLSI